MVTQLLYHASKTSVSDMQEIMRWKEQISQGHDEITLNFASSTLDLSRIGDVEPMFGGGIRHANSTQSLHSNTSRAPKLKVAPRMDESEYGEGPYYSLDRKQVLGERLALADSGYHTSDRRHSRSRPKSANVSVYDDANYSSLPRQRPHTATPGLTAKRSPHHRSVPKLNLSYADSPELEQPKMTVYRSDSPEMLTSPKSVDGVSAEGGYERYVSLGDYPMSSKRSTLPPSLHHLNVKSLSNRAPQTVLKRYDSITDSGIANSPSDATNRSHNSININGLSPGHRSKPPVIHVKETKGALSHHRSLPNLFSDKAQLDRQLDEKQANIDLIAGSDLSAEDKLNLMAAMCDTGELELNPEMSYKLQPRSSKGKTPMNSNSRVRPKSAGAKTPALSVPAKPPRRNPIKNGAMSKSTENLSSNSRNSSLQTSPDAKLVDKPKPEPVVTRVETTLKPPTVEASDSQTSVSETTGTTAIHRGDAAPEAATPAAAVHRSGSKKYGIDVAEWVSQQDPHDASSVESSELLSHTGSMAGHMRKLRTAKSDRLVL